MITTGLGPYPAAFAALRKMPLHTLWGAAWDAYYPQMAKWLDHERADIREAAVEQLTTAVFWAELGGSPKGATEVARAKERLTWLISEIDRTHLVHADTMVLFLKGLRSYDDPYRTTLLDWIDKISPQPPTGVDTGLIEGTRLLVAGSNGDVAAQTTEWLELLDHPSDYVRGCAAYLLGNACEDENAVPDRQTLFNIIGAKERERSGVAGPFWSPQYSGGTILVDEQTKPVTAWMLDLLEQRNGTPPPLPVMRFNDIAFYLHEMCSHSPDDMWRMLRSGHTALALLTATEMNERVDGVQPVLEALARHQDPEIAIRARNHLTAHYTKR